jgi:hypothetical protein
LITAILRAMNSLALFWRGLVRTRPLPVEPIEHPKSPNTGGDVNGAHARLGERIAREERQIAAQRGRALDRFQERWTQGITPVLRNVTGITPALLEADVRRFTTVDNERDRARLANELQERYGEAIIAKVAAGLGAGLPPLGSVARSGTVRAGPCPIDDRDALRLLLCGGFGACACPTQRIVNPLIFNAPAATGGFEFSADPAAGSLYVRDRFPILGAPHTFARLNGSFTVPGNATIVNVFSPVTVGHAKVTLAGLGYAHGWVTLQLRIVDPSDTDHDLVNCSLELINHWTWAGDFDTIHDRPPSGPVGLMGCFTRAPTLRAQPYLFSVELMADGTVAGFSGVQVSADVVVIDMLVITCP